jgi:non-homologous end joining protein Ku
MPTTKTNLDKAVEAHEYLPVLRAKRDRWVVQASKDGHSHEEIARRLGLRRQSVALIIRRTKDPEPVPRVVDLMANLEASVAAAKAARVRHPQPAASFDPDEVPSE